MQSLSRENRSYNAVVLVTAAVAAGGGLLYLRPLESSRPATEASRVDLESERIPARLWEDPWEAVQNRLRREREAATDRLRIPPPHNATYVACSDPAMQMEQPGSEANLLILPVTFREGAYVDEHESRVRTRYAVLAALEQEGFIPTQPGFLYAYCGPRPVRLDHIRSKLLQPLERHKCDSTARSAGSCVDGSGEPWECGEDAEVVPYEWFVANPLHPSGKEQPEGSSDESYDAVLVLWIRDALLRDEQINLRLQPPGTEDERCQVKQVSSRDREAGCDESLNGQGETVGAGKALGQGSASLYAKADVHVVGPSWSDSLVSIRRQLERKSDCMRCEPVAGAMGTFGFFSPWATLPQPFVRTLAGSSKSKDGKAEPQNGSRETRAEGAAGDPSCIDRVIKTDDALMPLIIQELELRRVDLAPGHHHYLDGEPLPEVALVSEWDTVYGRALSLAFADALLVERCRSGWSSACGAAESEKIVHMPSGIHRYVHLRGLDGVLPYDQDGESGRDGSSDEDRDEKKPRREELERPEGHSKLDYARRIAGELARKHAQARREGRPGIRAVGLLGSDVFDKLLLLQALRPMLPHAIFFTTDLDAQLFHPSELDWSRNLIVVSATGLKAQAVSQRFAAPVFRDSYQTSTFHAVRKALGVDAAEPGPCLYEVGRTGPVALRLPGTIDEKLAQQCAIAIGGAESTGAGHATAAAVVAVTFAALLLLLLGWQYEALSWESLWIIGPAVAAAFAIHALVASKPLEPAHLLSGISIWPTEFMRGLAGVVALWLIVQTARRSRACMTELSTSSRFKQIRERSNRWQSYLPETPGRQTLVRLSVATLLYMAFCLLIFQALGDTPITPARGANAFRMDFGALYAAVILLVVITFYVVDVNVACVQFVNGLSADADQMGSRALKDARLHYENPGRETREEMDRQLGYLQGVASITSCVGGLVYYPFVVLLLLILSRLSFFDRWIWPNGLILVISLTGLLALGAAVLLRVVAGRFRKGCLERMLALRLEAERDGSEADLQRVRTLTEAAEGLQEGAFVPLYEHPMIKAVLLPAGGLGTLTLLDVLAGMG